MGGKMALPRYCRAPHGKAFAFTSMPFVLIESATGIVSFFTGGLSIPPAVGVGTAVDLAVLLTGPAVAVIRVIRKKSE